jgi:hypothetical protein
MNRVQHFACNTNGRDFVLDTGIVFGTGLTMMEIGKGRSVRSEAEAA